MANVSIVMQSILIFLFSILSLQKMFGAKQQIDIFWRLDLPQWFRIVTGVVQCIGAIGLVIGFWIPWAAAAAGVWLFITMVGGMAAHFRVKDPIDKVVPAFVLALMAAAITAINLAEGW
ncbi:DoxX-like family protein [Paenibacillus uliginis N3/975]|uniref:DoxX-like family protein n=1 Tax=Paenibacillus uliginis N3/975 TaxID=1313296 RepID=A0A1X7GU38_9BACL|nr:DoxX family protein [Paenibacillus uliginis]SMF74554.1 DoxX-like family protein [Paenibacillus uliginis N3/975]